MHENFRDFLIKVSEDKDLCYFLERIAQELDAANLTAEEKAAFLSRNLTTVKNMLGDEFDDIMIFQWLPQGPQGA
jgi:hypothetical protein